MKRMLACVLISFALTAAVAAQVKSVYTSVGAKSCRTIEENPDEGGSYRGRCPGTGGYAVELLEGDLRQSIDLIAPKGAKYELDLWSRVSGGFSSIGEKLEWRVRNGRPYALILRYNASENPEKADRTTPYLVIVKITGNGACVTDVLGPRRNQNAEARRLADAAGGKACYTRQ